MTQFSLFHAETQRAGSAGYYSPVPRGCIAVIDDQKRYIYKLPVNMRRGFGRWLRQVFCTNGQRLTGSIRRGYHVN